MTIAPNPAPPAALLDISIDPAQVGTPRRAASPGTGGSKLWSDDGFTFRDVLDLINPLQHIPVISTIYRAITGDKIDTGARLIGGGLFGGPIGFAAAAANVAVTEAAGKDIGGNLMAMLSPGAAGTNGPAPAPAPVQLANREMPPAAIAPVPLTPAPRLAGAFAAPRVDRLAAAQNQLFAVPLPSQLSAESARAALDPNSIGAGAEDETRRPLTASRAEDLSAQELVQILLRDQAAGRETRTLGDTSAPEPFPTLELKE
ncbi:MAG TPA: hypothetical protein QF665_00555 [Alphaproteobacteria bacterium]|jgi:hypothetical protein|nr:hypothetical protein [Alphaproteobacteria bacterium]